MKREASTTATAGNSVRDSKDDDQIPDSLQTESELDERQEQRDDDLVPEFPLLDQMSQVLSLPQLKAGGENAVEVLSWGFNSVSDFFSSATESAKENEIVKSASSKFSEALDASKPSFNALNESVKPLVHQVSNSFAVATTLASESLNSLMNGVSSTTPPPHSSSSSLDGSAV